MYSIKEKWQMASDVEHYETQGQTRDDVKNYIQEWVEAWLDDCNEQNLKMNATINYKILKARMNIRYKREDSNSPAETYIMTLWAEKIDNEDK